MPDEILETTIASKEPEARRSRRRRGGPTEASPASKAIAFVVLVGGSFLFAYPFLWMIATSLRTRQGVAEGGITIWPVQWEWSNYLDGLSSFPFWQYLGNTLLATLLPVLFTVLASSAVGFAFARIPAPGSGIIFAIVLATMLLPGEVTLVPQFILFRELDMMDSLYPIILPAAFGSPFFIFLFRQFYLRLPQSLADAAMIDGAGWFRTWWSIYLPLSQPIIVAAAVLQFMTSWNNFLAPAIYVNTERWKTFPLALAGFSNANSTDTSLLMATSIVVVLPCILVFFFAQKHIVGGISFTGTK
ncbi:carbohydrate ABC transporter permease [Agromyces cerinus]|uniref:Carbohydrate ABC transporter membrane protein 2, CUT1 family n=1 Tax=Agromyces cerinus subsp. cerinus TaxID=232089 RepID=A0A1N6E814_9MICO|nr:carbohydrate ABC transporter permease [Agromyces cerinus]SIN79111.1 carbohydrate ABC transporter membrane protein 2, CUT1 family [Agromyces cerinus subsp. cerinus]